MVSKMENDMLVKGVTGFPDQAIVTVPDLADSIVLTSSAAGTWAGGYGAAAAILASGSNTVRRKIIGLIASAPSAVVDFQIQILEGTTTKIQVPVSPIVADTGAAAFIPFAHPVVIEAGNAINGKCACNGGVQKTISVKLMAVEMPF